MKRAPITHHIVAGHCFIVSIISCIISHRFLILYLIKFLQEPDSPDRLFLSSLFRLPEQYAVVGLDCHLYLPDILACRRLGGVDDAVGRSCHELASYIKSS